MPVHLASLIPLARWAHFALMTVVQLGQLKKWGELYAEIYIVIRQILGNRIEGLLH